MSEVHERRLADRLGGRMTPGSGSTWRAQMDVRQGHGDASSTYAVDGKSTLGKSISVTREMWAKAVEQAHELRPMLALLFFRDERLNVETSLVVVTDDDFAELYERAAAADRVQRYLETYPRYLDTYGDEASYLMSQDLLDVLVGREPRRAAG
jgi:hypothetical protein